MAFYGILKNEKRYPRGRELPGQAGWVADRLLRLRAMLNGQIESKRDPNSLIIGSWNIRHFDGGRPRLDESFHYIAEIIDHFDICAIQEVKNIEAMERLQNQLGGNEGMQRELQRAQNALRNVADASFRGVLLDDESAKNFFNEDLFQPFSELENQLARELDTIEREKKLFGARKAEVPDEYRDTVDRYYESLSKSNDN